ncbi:hypothetical protein MCAMS1_02832 [biofilm metagenome]
MINKVFLIGNLGADPVLRYTHGLAPVVNLRLATSIKYKDKITGEQKQQTEWHKIVAFNFLADIAAKHYKEGSQIYVEGKLRTHHWVDRNNMDRYDTMIEAVDLRILGKRVDSAGDVNETDGLPHDNFSDYED